MSLQDLYPNIAGAYPGQPGLPGQPQRPEYQSILGPNGGLMGPYRAQANTIPTTYTMSTDMSPWMNLQTQRINQEQGSMRDQLSRDTSMGLGTGMSNLAASGGLDSGARERLMTSSAAQRTQGLSGIGQQAAASRLDAGIQAEQMRRQAQQFNADARNRTSAFNTGALNQNSMFNAGNAIGGVNGQNAFNANVYGQDMQAWGAGKTADAMAAAANQEDPGLLGMGGFLGTGLGGRRGLLGTGLGGKGGGGGFGGFSF